MLRQGQLFEFYNGTTGETRTYELEWFEDRAHTPGARAKLRNVENDGIAQITVYWLTRKTPGPTGSVWSPVEAA